MGFDLSDDCVLPVTEFQVTAVGLAQPGVD